MSVKRIDILPPLFWLRYAHKTLILLITISQQESEKGDHLTDLYIKTKKNVYKTLQNKNVVMVLYNYIFYFTVY